MIYLFWQHLKITVTIVCRNSNVQRGPTAVRPAHNDVRLRERTLGRVGAHNDVTGKPLGLAIAHALAEQNLDFRIRRGAYNNKKNYIKIIYLKNMYDIKLQILVYSEIL
jgi:hypothetical protein